MKQRTTFGCYDANADFLKMDHKQFVDYARGHLTLAIGEGTFKSEVYTIVSMAVSRGIKQEYEAQQEKK